MGNKREIKMIQVTSLSLSKELWEKGLRIETEKWWCRLSPDTLVENGKEIREFTDKEHNWQVCEDTFGYKNYPAPSTDELLAVLFTSSIARIGMTPNSVWDDSATQIIPMSFYGEIPEALGKMILWLLSNGWRWDEEKRCLVK